MGLITATLPQYANGNFFIQAQGSNFSESAGSLSTFGVFNAPVVAGLPYGITIIPPSGTSYSRFGATFVASTDAVQDITAILDAAIPPPFGNGGTVTNTEGPLTAGFLTMGNGGDDLVPSPVSYGLTANTLATAGVLKVSGNSDSDASGVNLELVSASSNQTGILLANTSSAQEFFNAVAGSGGTNLPGYFIYDAANNNVVALFRSTDSNHGIISMQSENVIGWPDSADVFNQNLDTALSRASAGVVSIGNGTQGDASGGVKSAVIYGPAVKPTGSGPAGAWALSMDGFLSFCNGGTWQQMVPAV